MKLDIWKIGKIPWNMQLYIVRTDVYIAIVGITQSAVRDTY